MNKVGTLVEQLDTQRPGSGMLLVTSCNSLGILLRQVRLKV